MTEAQAVPQTSETVLIDSIDHFAMLVAYWHNNRMQQLVQALNVPDEVEISFQDESGEDVTLSPEQRKGFLAGLAMAKSLFAELPFVVDLQETDTAQDPIMEPVNV